MAEERPEAKEWPCANILGWLRIKRVADELFLPPWVLAVLPIQDFVALEALVTRGG